MADEEHLFRREAIHALQRDPFGEPVAALPASWRVLAVLLVTAFIVTLLLSPYLVWHRNEEARGWLVPEAGAIRVVADTSGRVSDLHLAVGDHVRAEQALLRLQHERVHSDGRLRSDSERQHLRDRITEVDQLLLLKARLGDSTSSGLRAQLAQQQRDEQLLVARLQNEAEQLSVANEQLARLRRAGAHVAQWDLLEQEQRVSQHQAALLVTQQQLSGGREAAAQLQVTLDNQPTVLAAELAELRLRKLALQQQLDELEFVDAHILYAPVDGVVASLAVTNSDAVTPGRVLLTLLPPDSTLVGHLFVSSAAIPYLQAGAEMSVWFDAYPKQHAPAVAARVRTIDQFPTRSQERPGDVLETHSRYRVTLELDLSGVEVTPGMALSAQVVLEQRNLLQWLLKPLQRDAKS